MEIILSNHCKSLTGSLGQGFGYFIVNRKGRFYSVRSKHSVPPDGHWRFITTCAELAQNGLHIADIRVSHQELSEALSEAGLDPSLGARHDNLSSSVSPESDSGLPLSGAPGVRPEKIYSASDICNLKITFSL